MPYLSLLLSSNASPSHSLTRSQRSKGWQPTSWSAAWPVRPKSCLQPGLKCWLLTSMTLAPSNWTWKSLGSKFLFSILSYRNICYGLVLFKDGTQTIGISRELVPEAGSQAPPQTYCVSIAQGPGIFLTSSAVRFTQANMREASVLALFSSSISHFIIFYSASFPLSLPLNMYEEICLSNKLI